MPGESLSDEEWLKAKIQQEGLTPFEREYVGSRLKIIFPPHSRFSEVGMVMPLSEFRQKYPLKLPRLEE
jgi:hypothetical protein